MDWYDDTRRLWDLYVTIKMFRDLDSLMNWLEEQTKSGMIWLYLIGFGALVLLFFIGALLGK